MTVTTEPGELYSFCVFKNPKFSLSRSHEKVPEQYKLHFHLVPAINCSGGFLTVCSEELTTENQIMRLRDQCGVTYTQLNLTVFNVYPNTKHYTEKLKQLSSSLSKLDTERSNASTGDFKAFSHDPRNNYS